MTQPTELTTQPIHPASIGRRMLQGAAFALMLITIFLFGAGESDPAWGKFWMIRPLIMVPVAGALGGAFYYFMDNMRYRGGWRKILAIMLSVAVYLFVLWVGTILGLDGTWWD